MLTGLQQLQADLSGRASAMDDVKTRSAQVDAEAKHAHLSLGEHATAGQASLEATLAKMTAWRHLRETTQQETDQLAVRLVPHLLCPLETLARVCSVPVPSPLASILPAFTADTKVEPTAPHEFAEALQREEALLRGGLAARFPLAAVQSTLAEVLPVVERLREDLAALEQVLQTLQRELDQYAAEVDLQSKLHDTYTAFAARSKQLRKELLLQLHLQLAASDSDSDSNSEEDKDPAQQIKAQQQSTLARFRSEWLPLVELCWTCRPELLLRRWCELQPWAQLDAKAKRKLQRKRAKTAQAPGALHGPGLGPAEELQPWVEHMLTSLHTRGLERPELSLEAYVLLDVASASDARHPVQQARAPNGEVVALKRFTVAARDLASLRKVPCVQTRLLCSHNRHSIKTGAAFHVWSVMCRRHACCSAWLATRTLSVSTAPLWKSVTSLWRCPSTRAGR